MPSFFYKRYIYLWNTLSPIGVLPFTRRDINRKAVDTGNTTWGKLSNENQKFTFLAMVGNDPIKIRLSTEPKNRIFVSKLMHEKSKTSILK